MSSKRIIGYVIKGALIVIAIWALTPYLYSTVAPDEVMNESMDDLTVEMQKIYVADGSLPGVPTLPLQEQSERPSEEAQPSAPPTDEPEALPEPAATEEAETRVEITPPAPQPIIVASGQFEGKTFHRGSGTAELVKTGDRYAVRFESDFSVTNGPDLFVHFGNNNKVDKSARLGKLKGSKGSQNYVVPTDIDPTQYSEVWIYCRAFSVTFAVATLQ